MPSGFWVVWLTRAQPHAISAGRDAPALRHDAHSFARASFQLQHFHSELFVLERFAAKQPYRLVVVVDPLHKFRAVRRVLTEIADVELGTAAMHQDDVVRAVLAIIRYDLVLAVSSEFHWIGA